ncbi:hypothetical protein D3C85_726640 [compost metagenome]
MQFAGDDFADGGFQISAAGNDGRRLAAQFQRHRHQVLGGGAHDVLADAAGTGKQQVVERLAAERLADFGSTGNDRDFILGVHRAEHPREQFGGFRVVFRNLDHHPVAGSQCACQTVEDHIPRKIPGRENAHHAQRLKLHPRLATVGGSLVRLHPFGDFCLGILQRCQRPQHIEQTREIGAAVTEVRGQGFDDFALVVDQQADGAVDQFTALFRRPRLVGQTGGALFVENDADIGSTQVFIGTHGVSTSMQWSVRGAVNQVSGRYTGGLAPWIGSGS